MGPTWRPSGRSHPSCGRWTHSCRSTRRSARRAPGSRPARWRARGRVRRCRRSRCRVWGHGAVSASSQVRTAGSSPPHPESRRGQDWGRGVRVTAERALSLPGVWRSFTPDPGADGTPPQQHSHSPSLHRPIAAEPDVGVLDHEPHARPLREAHGRLVQLELLDPDPAQQQAGRSGPRKARAARGCRETPRIQGRGAEAQLEAALCRLQAPAGSVHV